MRHSIVLLLGGLLSLWPLRTEAADPTDTVRILGVGNSWTRDSMRQIWAIAHSAGHPVIIGHAYLGGSRLKDQFFGISDTNYCYKHAGQPQKVHSTYQYWKYKDGPNAVKEPSKGYQNGHAGIGVSLEKAVSDEKWDWIVFQPEATFGGDYREHLGLTADGYDLRSLLESVCTMLPDGAAPGIALMVPFAYPQGNTDYRPALVHYCNDDIEPANQKEWDKLYRKQYAQIQAAAPIVAGHIGAKAVVNVGAAIEAARADRDLSRAGYKLQRSQGNTHLAEGLPMYIASLCYAYTLLGLRPDDISFYPADGSYTVSGDRGETVASDFILDESLARKARLLTWKALNNPPHCQQKTILPAKNK